MGEEEENNYEEIKSTGKYPADAVLLRTIRKMKDNKVLVRVNGESKMMNTTMTEQ